MDLTKLNNPFIKVTWQDSPENFTSEKIRRVKYYFQEKYKTKHIQIITKPIDSSKDTKLKSLDLSDNILDPLYQKELMKDFIEENKIDIKWELIDRLDNRVNLQIDKSNKNKVKFNKWFIKKIEFSNFLSFGKNNIIEFDKLEGITVIESTPKNFGGKSTATVDLLLFLFFNITTKTKTNIEIFNKFSEEDEVYVKGEITIDGVDYFIERKIIRKKSKINEYNVTNKLEFYKRKDDGTFENLTGEQRRETENFITASIGTQEDFLSTILTTGYNLEELLDSKPTARGLILTKFLGLEAIKEKEETCKEIYNEWSKKLVSNTFNITQLEDDNSKYDDDITQSERDIIKLKDDLSANENELKNLENKRDEVLSSKNNDIDNELIKTNPISLKKEIDELEQQKKSIQKNILSIEVKEPKKYYLEEEHNKLKDNISQINLENKSHQHEIKQKEDLINKLETGSICPMCKRPLEDVDHTDEIKRIKKEVDSIGKKIDKNKTKLEKLNLDNVTLSELKVEYENYEKNKLKKAKYELEFDQKNFEIENKNFKLNNYENNRKKLEHNQKIDVELTSLRTKIDTAKANIKLFNTNIEKLKNNISNLKEKISVNIDLIKKIKTEEELLSTFKIYLSIYGKNGISKIILKNMIPLLNRELFKLLIDSCHFLLEININDKNEVDFIMIDTETRVSKPLNSGSGFERTISSLALRSVLTKISSLPKPNIVVMDEVFGKIADENLDLVGEFFKKIKNYFEHIFVISHNPLIRNWSDNLLMIKKEENISTIDFISTKIS